MIKDSEMKDKWISSNRIFKTASEAKCHIAGLALQELRKMPDPTPATRPPATPDARAPERTSSGAIDGRRGPVVKSEHSEERRPDHANGMGHRDDDSLRFHVRYDERGHSRGRPVVPYPTLLQSSEHTRLDEQRDLIHRIVTLYGHSSGPSPFVLNDAMASQAFLEGIAMGQRLENSARNLPEE